MKNTPLKIIAKSILIPLIIVALTHVGIRTAASIDIPTSSDISNFAPALTVTVSDGGSSSSATTNVGSNITFTATAKDMNSNQYYLAICKTNAITAGNDTAPTCASVPNTWAISTATNTDTQASITYTTQIGDSESSAWYAFVCDKVASTAACYPASVSGDQGLAVGAVTFTGVPVDGATLTINSVTYEFDTAGNGVTGGNTEVDTASAQVAADVAITLVAVEAGAGSHMTDRSNIVYVYADTAGDSTIGMAEAGDTGDLIALSASTLTGGSNANASPFAVNHAPTFGTVTVTDTLNGEINPGDTLRFKLVNAQIDDIDVSPSQDTINMYICTSATTAFDYGTNSCTSGSLICSHTSVNPTTTGATCDETGNTLVPPTDIHSTENFKVYVEDSHNFAGTGTSAQSYTIQNTAPTHDTPELDIHAPTLPNSVGYWQFEDGASATSFDDETINNNNGSCTNCPTWTQTGYSGGAYDFDGTNDYITMPLGPLSNFTASVWVKPDGFGDERDILSRNPNFFIRLGENCADNKINFGAWNNSMWVEACSTAALTADEWSLLTYVFDGSNLILYINGSYDSTTAFSGTFPLTTTDLTIGTAAWSPGTYLFSGLIDEPHIYSRALSATEISKIYSAYAGAPEADLMSHWSFNDGPDGYTQALNINREGSWDTVHVHDPSVIKDGNVYKMWHSGYNGSHYRILYSTSTNGTTWSTSVQALNYNLEGNWDTNDAYAPSVIKDGDIYKMWYAGSNGSNSRILYTTSTNGINWSTPVQALNKNVEGNWDVNHATSPSVIKDGSTYKMWYGGYTAPYWRILYSTSTNGTTWTTPVQALNYNVEGTWDTLAAYSPSVIKDGSTYKMWYSAGTATNSRVLYSTSTNGTTWSAPQRAMNYNQEGSWDTTHSYTPEVIKDGNSYRMWYVGGGANYRIIHTKINYMDEFGENDGVMGGGVAPALTTGYYGKAINFNGSSNYVSLGKGADLNLYGDITVSAWVKLDTLPTNYAVIAVKGTASTSDPWQLGVTNTGIPYFFWGDATQSWVTACQTTPGLIKTNTWYHIVATRNSSKCYIYVNAEVVEDESMIGINYPAYSGSGSVEARIGMSSNASPALQHPFDGIIDEVRIYDAALNATKVQQLYYSSEYHDSNQDLSCKPINIADHDVDTTTTIYNWKKNGSSIAVLNMPFDSNITSTATDSVLDYSGNTNYGTLGGGTSGYAPTWSSSGVKGGAYDFDGTDDFIDLGTDASTDITDMVTVEAWVKTDTISSGQRVIAQRYGVNGGYNLMQFDDRLAFTIGNGTAYVSAGSSSPISTGAWYHVVGTYDTNGGANNLRIYVNGILANSSTQTGFGSVPQPLSIGSANEFTNYFWDGIIDEVHLYHSILSPEQIAQNYNNGKPLYNTITESMTSASDTSWLADVTINDAQASYSNSTTKATNIFDPGNAEPVQGTPSARAHALLDSGSMGYWQLEDGASATSFDDETTNNNNVACSGGGCPAWTAEGAVGGAYVFDGTNDFLSITDNSSLDRTDDMSISVWVKPTSTMTSGGGAHCLVAKYDGTGAGQGYNINYNDSGQIVANYLPDASPLSYTTNLNANTWYHIVTTYDKGGLTKIYLNGSEVTSDTSINLENFTTPLKIGACIDNPGYLFAGVIDEPHIYSRALSGTEVKNLYNNNSYIYGTMDIGASPRSLSDSDSDVTYVTTDWRKNGTSAALLNMSFNKNVTSTTAGAVTDYSSYANNGQLGGGNASYIPTWTNASTCGNNSGGCYDFDGTDDYIKVNDSSSLGTITDKLTLEAWVKREAEITSTVVGQFDCTKYSYRLSTEGSGWGGARFILDKDGGSPDDLGLLGTDNGLLPNNWAHIAGVYDGSTAKVYINGVLKNTANFSGNLYNSDRPLWIGAERECGDTSMRNMFNGKIDGIKIFNRALTASQIATEYNAGKANYQNIVYGELSIGDTWKANVTAFDANGNEDGTITSNELEILGFSTAPSDGSSSATTPTTAGNNVTFTATANTASGRQWYLAICKTNAVTAGNDTAPTCGGGSWAISTATNDATQATAIYPTSSADTVSNNWYAFACEKLASTATCSPASQGSGNTGSPFVMNSRPSFVSISSVDSAGSEILVDGNMEGADTSAWTAVNSPTVTKETTNPHGGSKVLRIARSTVDNAQVTQAILTLNKRYRITGWARSDGNATPLIFMGEAGNIWKGTTSTSWQYFDATGYASSRNTVNLVTYIATGTQYTEWDDVSVFEVGLEPGNTTRFNLSAVDKNNDSLTAVVCDASGFNDTTRACTGTELCRKSSSWTQAEVAAWKRLTSGVSTDLNDIDFISSTTGWSVGNGGKVVKTTDGGATWGEQISGTTNNLNGVYFVDGSNGWAVGNSGTVLKYNGTSWSAQTSTVSDHLNSIYCLSSTSCWAVGDDDGSSGTIIRTTDGSTWAEQTSNTTQDLNSVFMYNSSNGWAVGDGGVIRYYNGSTWASQTSGTTENLNAVLFTSATTGWVAGDKGEAFYTSDGGTTWIPKPSHSVYDLHDIHFTDSTDGWMSGEYGAVVGTTDGGAGVMNNVQSVVTSFSHTVALKNNGTVWAWGYNNNGQLGDGTTTDKIAPVQVSGLTGITAVAVSGNHSMALKNDGTVWAWGHNSYNQLGDGSTTQRNAPVKVAGLTGVTAIAAGYYHSMALKSDGTVWAWGRNVFGQLGDGTTTDRTTPVQVSGLTGITAISGSYFHNLALKNDGTVWAWGWNVYGQLGDDSTTQRETPVQVSGLTGITAIAVGNYHGLARKNDGTVWAWGYNGNGLLGDGSTTQRNTPVQVSVVSGISTVSGGVYHSLARKNDGTVWAWGWNAFGQLGDGSTTQRNAPVQVPGLTGVTAVAGGYIHSIVLKDDGTLWSWGNNGSGQMGNGTTNQRYTPIQVSGLTGITAISGGYYHSLARKNDGTVWAWGSNGNAQLGDGTGIQREAPVQASGLTGATAVAGFYYHSIALKNDNTVWTWGGNNNGQLGDGTTTNRTSPAQISALTGITAVAGGYYHSMALKNDNTVWSWGYNNYGQVGDGSTTQRNAPVQVTGLTDVTAIAGGNFHSLARKSDGTVWAWGWNVYGQLGDNTQIQRETPVQVSGLTGITALAGGMYHSIALKDDGTVWTWGWNYYGQLGDSTTTYRPTPVQVTGLTGITAIAGGSYQSMALKNDGTVWAWGRNAYSQLGDGSTVNRLTPVQVSGLTGITAIAEGYYHSMAVKSDGTVVAWGRNDYGQLGYGIDLNKFKPWPVADKESVGWNVRQYTDTNDNIYGIDFTDSFTGFASGASGILAEGIDSVSGYCDDTTNYISIPQAHSYTASANKYTVNVFDTLNLTDNSSDENQGIDVEDITPVLISYTATDTPTISAGGSDTIDYSAVISDDNGEADITVVEGYLFDDDAIDLASGICTTDENDCIYDSDCTINTGYGTNIQIQANCQSAMYFNANDSANWEAHVNPSSDLGKTTTLANTNVNLTNPALSGINIVQTSIAYGAVAIGDVSTRKETTVQNMGNQTIDVLLDGDNMCTDYPTCAGSSMVVGQQKWYHTDTDFNYGASTTNLGPFTLVGTAATTSEATGCVNRDIAIRDAHDVSATDESVWFKLGIPNEQALGTYTGQNTFATTSACTGETCDNTTDDDSDGSADCADILECTLHPHCHTLDLPMTSSEHDTGNNRTLDISDNDLHATFGDGATSTTFPTKLTGAGYSFDGTSDYLNLGDPVSTVFDLDYGDTFTVSAWIYPETFSLTNGVILAKRGVSYIGYALGFNQGYNKLMFEQLATFATDHLYVGWEEPPLNQWTHLTLTSDGTNASGVKMYYDGILQSRNIYYDTLSSSIANTIDLNVGRDTYDSGGIYFDGSIAEAKIFNSALTETQVKDIYYEHLSVFK